MTPDRDTPRLLLAALRLSTGAGAFLAPQLAARTLALEPDAQSVYAVRLFAARNVAMAAGLWVSPRSARRSWWQAGVVCDGLDLVAALLALRAGKARSSAVSDAGASLLAVGLGLVGLLADRGDPR